MAIPAIAETNRHLLLPLSPRQQFEIYKALCPAIFSVVEVDGNGAGLEIFHAGKKETTLLEWALQLCIPALLGSCSGVEHCPSY